MAKWLTPQQFQMISPGHYPAAVASAPVLSMTKEQLMAYQQKWLADAQVKIDALWATGVCSKGQTIAVMYDLCPFK